LSIRVCKKKLQIAIPVRNGGIGPVRSQVLQRMLAFPAALC
jgi:hypothetical protein